MTKYRKFYFLLDMHKFNFLKYHFPLKYSIRLHIKVINVRNILNNIVQLIRKFLCKS